MRLNLPILVEDHYPESAMRSLNRSCISGHLLNLPVGRSSSMNRTVGKLAPAAIMAISTLFTTAVRADGDHRNSYVVTPLVSDIAGAAAHQDTVLQNAWGVAFSPAGSPFWVNDNATGCSTLYDGTGAAVALQVKIPLPGNIVPAAACTHVDPNNPPSPSPAAPTGIVWNPSARFLVPGTTIQAAFIFATEDGTISAWGGGLTPPNAAVIAADNSANPMAGAGAVYKALVFAVNAKGAFLFATNFRAGTIDVFAPTGPGGTYVLTTTDGGFADPAIPAGYAPFGMQNIDGDLFVTFAKQNAEKPDDVAGAGNGFVDVFDTGGHTGFLQLLPIQRCDSDRQLRGWADQCVRQERALSRRTRGRERQSDRERRPLDCVAGWRPELQPGHAFLHRRPERREGWRIRDDYAVESRLIAAHTEWAHRARSPLADSADVPVGSATGASLGLPALPQRPLL